MFRVEERDIRFNLYEYLNIEELLKLPAFQEMDKEMFDMFLDNAIKFATDVLAPINLTGDKEGCKLNEDGTVTIPNGYREAMDAYAEGGWMGMTAPPEYGGMGAPNMINMATMEAFAGAALAFTMYPGLTHAAAALIVDEGTDEQKNLFVERMLTGQWGGTMCLTEPQAGSAVGDSRAKAVKVRDGWYNIEGSKIFISSGENPMVENNIHLVLARTPDAPAGIKGLSLFIVPKYRINEDASLGEFNDVTCVGVEHKMGIKGSVTATMAFGENGKCEGWIVGKEGDGIRIMFHMMNEARLGVGLLSLGVAATAYNESLDYAKERIQGVDMRNMKDPNAARVAIIKHPDVRRMLMIQRSYVHGLRALMLRTAKLTDQALKGEGPQQTTAQGLVELLTPICKGYGSDMAFEVCNLAVQTLGGYGYIAEYPVEQYLRDAKILAIYEGTNGIQAMDLVGRKLGMQKGAVFMTFMGTLHGFMFQAKKHALGQELIEEIEQSMKDLQNMAMKFMNESPLYVLQQATPFMKFMGNLVMAWLLTEQAIIASDKLDALFAAKNAETKDAKKALIAENPEAAFYDGKVQTARFFVKNLLPENRSLVQAMGNQDTSLMDINLEI